MENSGFLRWRKIPIEGRFGLFASAFAVIVTLLIYWYAVASPSVAQRKMEAFILWILIFGPLAAIARALRLEWSWWDDPFSPTALLQLAVTCIFNGLLCLPWGVGAGFIVRAVSKALKK